MSRLLSIALLASLGGCFCGCTLDVLPVHLEEDTPENRELVERAAGEAFGLSVAFVDDPDGAVTIDLRRQGHDVPIGTVVQVGEASDEGTCTPSLWAHASPTIVAHELGHALGLEHTLIDDSNLMTKGNVVSWDVSDTQMLTIWRGVESLHDCE